MVRWTPVRLGVLQTIVVGSIIFAGPTLLAWVLGDSMRYRRAYYVSLEDRAARLERERDAQAQIAAATERARIARELHDVVAHNVSVMVVQANGASYALDSEPEKARQALAAIASTGRQALAEMRRLLGVLRSGDGETGLAPLPGDRPAQRTAGADAGQRAGRGFHRGRGAGPIAGRGSPGRVPDRPGVADEHAQARGPECVRPGDLAVLRGRAGAADHRRRPWRRRGRR